MANTKTTIRVPRPLIELSKEEAKLYRSLAKMIIEADNWQPIFSIELAEAAQTFYRMQEAKSKAIQSGWVEEYEQGSNITGYTTYYFKEKAAWEKHVEKLGLAPASRDKIKSYKNTEKQQPGIFAKIKDIQTAAKKKAAK